mmetsp:Transcript_5308/g.14974  ORF Transcript_5308/g.14974 Transcript_5308/m.14974 type:complete len:207 (+) Transcript_5308:1141-1761(+)
MPRYCPDIPPMLAEDHLLPTCCKVPHLHHLIVTPRCKLQVRCRKGDAPHRLRVRLELLHVVHIGLPVLDVTVVLSGHHVVSIVRPHNTPNRGVMRLPHQLEVEGEAVPQGQLPARGTRHQPPPLRHPRHHVHRVPYFVDGCADVSCAECIRWRIVHSRRGCPVLRPLWSRRLPQSVPVVTLRDPVVYVRHHRRVEIDRLPRAYSLP